MNNKILKYSEIYFLKFESCPNELLLQNNTTMKNGTKNMFDLMVKLLV